MYGLDDSVDLTFFHGLTLLEARSSEFQLNVRFQKDVAISAEGGVSLDGVAVNAGNAESSLAPLLGKKV